MSRAASPKNCAKFSGNGSHRPNSCSERLLTYWVRPFGQPGAMAVTALVANDRHALGEPAQKVL